ncbi:MAG: tRNA methyl transferase PRC-barrel domain-containing protein, partial [Acidimicrobiales bacterium]
SYVLSMLTQNELSQLILPVGEMTKADVRAKAALYGLRTAEKAESQEVCFIHSATGRQEFLGDRIALHRGSVVDGDGKFLGEVDAVEMVTVGQRRGLDLGGNQSRRYAVAVDVPARRVVVDSAEHLLADHVMIGAPTWVSDPLGAGERVLVQTSAHGRAFAAEFAGGSLICDAPQRKVAAGQTVAFYDPEEPDSVLGSALAA